MVLRSTYYAIDVKNPFGFFYSGSRSSFVLQRRDNDAYRRDESHLTTGTVQHALHDLRSGNQKEDNRRHFHEGRFGHFVRHGPEFGFLSPLLWNCRFTMKLWKIWSWSRKRCISVKVSLRLLALHEAPLLRRNSAGLQLTPMFPLFSPIPIFLSWSFEKYRTNTVDRWWLAMLWYLTVHHDQFWRHADCFKRKKNRKSKNYSLLSY